MIRDNALRLAGILAIITAVVHSLQGDAILKILELSDSDLAFVRSTHQLGSMGWMAGGVLLMAAANMRFQGARNWIVGVFVFIYGFPAVGNIVLNRGRPSFGWIALSLVVIFALIGRTSKIKDQDSVFL